MLARRRAVTIELTPAEYGAVQAESFETDRSRGRILRELALPGLVKLVAKHSDRLHLPVADGQEGEDGAND